MALATLANVQLLSGISTTDIPDATITSLIAITDLEVLQDVLVYHYADSPEGSPDGSRTTFKVPGKRPIADADADGTLTDDVVVRVYTPNTSTGFDTVANATVSSVSADALTFVLSAAPASGTRLEVDWAEEPAGYDQRLEQIKEAANYLCAFAALVNVMGGVISAGQGYKIGSFSIDKSSDSVQVAKARELHSRYASIMASLSFVSAGKF